MSGASSVKRGTSSIKSPKSPRSPKIKIGSSIVSDTEIEDNKSTAESAVSKKDPRYPERFPFRPDRYQLSLENTAPGEAPPYILDKDSFQQEAPPARLEIHLEYRYVTTYYIFLLRDHSSITSAKRWVGGVRKWQFLMVYSTVNHQRVGWLGLKKSKK